MSWKWIYWTFSVVLIAGWVAPSPVLAQGEVGTMSLDEDDGDSDGDSDSDSDQGAPPLATVTVDCAAGGSIQAALGNPAMELIIEISGICDEDVRIGRDDVTLIGASGNADLDGIRGVGPNVPGTAVLQVIDADDVTVQSLGIFDGLRDGISATGVRGLSINDSKVTGHGRHALRTLDVFFVASSNTELSSSRFAVSGSGGVSCDQCTIDGGTIGWVAFEGQQSIRNSTVIDSTFGVWSQTSANLTVSNSTITSNDAAAIVLADANLSFQGSTLNNWLFCDTRSQLVLDGSEQTGGPGFNIFDNDCYVSLSGGSEVLGFQAINHFARMVIEDTSLVNGDLGCGSGGDAWCPDASVNVTGGSCGQCL